MWLGGLGFQKLWIYITKGCFHTRFSFPGWLISERKFFKDFLNIFLFKIIITWGHFYVSFISLGQMVLEKKMFVNFPDKKSIIINRSTLENGFFLYFYKSEFPLPKSVLC